MQEKKRENREEKQEKRGETARQTRFYVKYDNVIRVRLAKAET